MPHNGTRPELPAFGRRSIKPLLCFMTIAGDVRPYTNRMLCRPIRQRRPAITLKALCRCL
jgi:hypothetical protein